MARQKNSEIDAQLRALGALTGAIDGVYNEWEGLPFVEIVPGYLVLRKDLNQLIDIQDMGREAYSEDFGECWQGFNSDRAWNWYLKDGRIIFTTGRL